MRAYELLTPPLFAWLPVATVGGGVEICEYVGVGVRDFGTAATWLDGGGVMLPPVALLTRLD